MKKIKQKHLEWIVGGIVLISIGVTIWSAASAGRHIYYRLFYKDLVEETIVEMVKPEYLNKL